MASSLNRLIRRSASSADVSDLVRFSERTGPFLSALVPTPSEHADAAHRYDISAKNLVRDAADIGWSEELCAVLEQHLDGLSHADAEALCVLQAADGSMLVETLLGGVTTPLISIDAAPRLAVAMESRQRILPHLLIDTDRSGADVIGFDGGTVVDEQHVDGETLHIHRGHPGGWSQRRFQQRAENTWEANADTVIAAALEIADELEPALICVAGTERAQALVLNGLSDRTAIPVVQLESGEGEAIAAETIKMVDDHHARLLRDVLESARQAVASGTGSTGHDVLGQLVDGRVDTLLVNDGASDQTAGTMDDPGTRDVDAAIVAALRSGAAVVVVPAAEPLVEGLASVNRW